MNKKSFLLSAFIVFIAFNKLVAQCSADFIPIAVDPFTRQFNYVYSAPDDSATIFQWAFGDGDTAYTQNTAHTYSDTGVFQVCLTVNYRNAGCQADTCLMIRIDTSCHAQFTYTYQPWLSQPEQDIYFFTDSSTGEDSSTIYNWDFGVGDFSTLQNIAFTYEPDDSGAEQVCLTIHNNDNGCTSQYCKTIQVDNLCIGATYTYALNGNVCTFKANVCGQWDSISWNFGDGVTANYGDSVVHTYVAGIDSYYVCMEVFITSECGYFYPCKSIDCQQIKITPTGISAIPAPNESLLVYPDPASDHINISVTQIRFPVELKVTDVTGKILIKNSFDGASRQVDVSNLATGIYFIQICNAAGENAITRFIKQ